VAYVALPTAAIINCMLVGRERELEMAQLKALFGG
jgi:hypothetical protein